MFPLRDDNPITITPVVTWALIAVNAVVFMYQLSLGQNAAQLFVYRFGAIPAVISGTEHLPEKLVAVPPAMSLFTSMFLHGGWMHLVGNMWFLWIFGNNIEEAMGHTRYLLFYLLCGFMAAGSHIFAYPDSTIPTIGASGAIAGALGAYIMLYPRARVWTLIFVFFFIRLIYIPAWMVLGAWILLQFINGSMAVGAQNTGGVAFWAHVGGFIAGVLLVAFFKKRSVRFFNPPRLHENIYYNGDTI
ncbi:MAG: rhomboid family intramembrane serine protease [Acidobacteria bacterium]|nr:rhomboid family intramembrane serine protease [Acidobacteriota bacterium]